MKLAALAAEAGARIVTHPEKAAEVEVTRIYAGDAISELLNAASPTTLLVTNLANSHLTRVTHLMDAPGICLLRNVDPDPALVAAAREHGAVLMVAPGGMFETCGCLYRCLQIPNPPQP